MINEMTYWVALSCMEGLTNAEKNTLLVELHRRGITLADFFRKASDDWRRYESIAMMGERGVAAFEAARKALPNSAFIAEELLSQRYHLLPVMSADYPARIKRCLKYASPVLLYCRGNLRLLERGTVSALGSPYPSDEALAFAASLGQSVAREGSTLISGEAPGCDNTALEATLSSGGGAVVVIPEGIMKFGTGFERLFRYISRGKLAVVSSFSPDAYRNSERQTLSDRLILALSDKVYAAPTDPRSALHATLQSYLSAGHSVIPF